MPTSNTKQESSNGRKTIDFVAQFFAAFLPSWRHKVNKKSVRFDFQAGISGAILLFPQAMAYAVIAGLPPIYGIYCALIPTMVAAYFGSSLHLVSGPTAAISLFLFSTVAPLATPGSADYIAIILLITFLCGVIQAALGLFRMGTIVNFVSDSVIIGFTSGAAILIMASQSSSLLGIAKGDAHNIFGFIYHLGSNLQDINWYAFSTGLVTIAASLLAINVKAINQRIPFLIFSLIIGMIYAAGLNYFAGGPEVTHLAAAGTITSVIPAVSVPSLDLELIRTLIPTALALALLGLTEALSIARSVTLKSGQIIDSNREFTAQGLSNIFGAFFSGYASSGSFTRTGANYEANAKTPMAAIFSSIFVLLIGLLLAPLTTYLVKPVLSGALVVIAFKLINVEHIKKLHKSSRRASIVMWVSLISSLLVGLEFAIFAGAGLSMLFYLDRVSHPKVSHARASRQQNSYHFLHSKRPTDCPQLLILFIDGSLFFGATAYLHQKIATYREKFPERKHLLILCSGVNHLDIHAAELLKRITLEQRNLGGDVYFHYVKSRPMRVLIATGINKIIGKSNFFQTGPGTLSYIYDRLDTNTCENCEIKAFKVCHRKAEERASMETLTAATEMLNNDDKEVSEPATTMTSEEIDAALKEQE